MERKCDAGRGRRHLARGKHSGGRLLRRTYSARAYWTRSGSSARVGADPNDDHRYVRLLHRPQTGQHGAAVADDVGYAAYDPGSRPVAVTFLSFFTYDVFDGNAKSIPMRSNSSMIRKFTRCECSMKLHQSAGAYQ